MFENHTLKWWLGISSDVIIFVLSYCSIIKDLFQQLKYFVTKLNKNKNCCASRQEWEKEVEGGIAEADAEDGEAKGAWGACVGSGEQRWGGAWKELSGMIMFYILVVIWITQLYAFIKTFPVGMYSLLQKGKKS